MGESPLKKRREWIHAICVKFFPIFLKERGGSMLVVIKEVCVMTKKKINGSLLPKNHNTIVTPHQNCATNGFFCE
jgi:hypothetical protein